MENFHEINTQAVGKKSIAGTWEKLQTETTSHLHSVTPRFFINRAPHQVNLLSTSFHLLYSTTVSNKSKWRKVVGSLSDFLIGLACVLAGHVSWSWGLGYTAGCGCSNVGRGWSMGSIGDMISGEGIHNWWSVAVQGQYWWILYSGDVEEI